MTSALLGYYCSLLLRNYGKNCTGSDNRSIPVYLGQLPLGKKTPASYIVVQRNLLKKLLRLIRKKSHTVG